MPVDVDENEAAMQAVIDDMGAAARKFKADKYTPKPKLGEESSESHAPEEESGEHEMPSADELERLIGGAKDW